MSTLTTLANFRVVCGLTAGDTSQDAILQLSLDYAEGVFISETARDFTWKANYDEVIEVTSSVGQDRFQLSQYPVTGIVAMTFSEQGFQFSQSNVSPTWRVRNKIGYLIFNTALESGTTIWVTYAAGYTVAPYVLPADIPMAIMTYASDIKNKSAIMGFASEKLGDRSYTMVNFDTKSGFPPQFDMAIQRHGKSFFTL